MAHFIIEYSANLEHEIDMPALFQRLNETAAETAIFPLGGLRFRAVKCEEYLIADGDIDNAFVHMSLKLGHGRSLEVRKAVGEMIFKTLVDNLKHLYDSRPMGISFEIEELNEDLNFKINNIHDYIRSKQKSD